MTYKNKYNDFYNKRNFSSLPQEKKKDQECFDNDKATDKS